DLLEKSCQTVSLTTDLWTARNKTGYIGVTAHWINDQFELNEILLCLEKIPYPHTGRIIREFLVRIVSEFNLLTKVLCIVTNNGSNMVVAIQGWNSVERLPCTAHTLQLLINCTFKKKHHQIQHIQDLVKFFDSPKQSQRLDNAQTEVCKNKQKDLSKDNLASSDNS
ncbi:20764_t:CDS:1, partial [Gigaspora rosea]